MSNIRNVIEDHEKKYLKKNLFVQRMVLIVLGFVMLGFAVGMLILNVQKKTLAYSETGNAGYSVCLKPNSYFSDKCLGKDKQYIASIIDNIPVNFNYDFSADAPLKTVDYSYEITARTVANDSSDTSKKSLYDNTETLVKKTAGKKIDAAGFVLNPSVTIDYNKYNDLISQLRSEYALTLDSNLIVTMSVDVNGTAEGYKEPMSDHQEIAVTIPLSERTINVSLASKDAASNGAFEEVVPSVMNTIYLIAAIVGGVMALLGLALTVLVVLRRRGAESEYEKELGRILREYNQLIIEADHVPAIDKKHLVEVSDFDELLDARETIQKPIVHVNLDDDRSLFVIEDPGTSYSFILAGAKKVRRSPSATKPVKRERARA
jgi:hypothetical protein